jgi:hypothetical protein
MLPINDPFESFRAKKEVERLEQKIRSSAAVRCPQPQEGQAAPPAAPQAKKPSKPAIDAFSARSWIY